jgi:hypothetical protein
VAAFSSGTPQTPDDTGVVGRYEAAKELQRAKLAGFASGVPDVAGAPVSAGTNPALTPPPAPMLGGAPAPPMPQQQAQPMQPAPTPMASGTIVTKPTLAVLGEGDSPEAVIPLNSKSGNKTSLSMLSPMSRYQRRSITPD